MARDNRGPSVSQFVLQRLPWLVGGGGLLVYLLTLNHWISLQSLGMVARVSGWLWEPQVGRPLTVAVFFPFRVLPESWIPVALNLFTAVCASLVLVLLARSVALLRHDVSPDVPLRTEPSAFLLPGPQAWIPPVLAALVCGLQLSFWEQATSASGEMIDLLVFAYVIRCLLEFRLSRQDRWLWKAACVAAAGLANHWLMIGLFPVLLVAIAGMKGLGEFLNRKFLLRLSLWTLAGLGLYLLLPMAQRWFGNGGFWPTLQGNLQSQAEALSMLRTPGMRLVASTVLLPLLVISIPWKSHSVQSADDNPFGVFVIQASGHAVHALFLFLPVWLALDPDFSPRHFASGIFLFPLYYLSALVFGKCAGYLLLFKGRARTAARVISWALLCALPLLLGWRNAGQVALLNGPSLHQLARDLRADLPDGKSALLAEDPKQLLLLRAELGRYEPDKSVLLVEITSLESPVYLRYMGERFKSRWPSVLTNVVNKSVPVLSAAAASALAQKETLFWLGPAFTPLFEQFTASPKGVLWRLAPRKKGEPVRAATADVTAYAQIWEQRWTNHLQGLVTRARPGGRDKPPPNLFADMLRLGPHHNATVSWLCDFYSRALNTYGVESRRFGRFQETEIWLRRALELKPDNLSARVTLEYTSRCLRGDCARLKTEAVHQQFPDLFNRNTDWRRNILVDGPVDEPTFLFRTGRVLGGAGLLRQSAAAFARSAELAPDWATPRLWLAQTALDLRDFTGALRLAEAIETSNLAVDGLGRARLLDCEASALWGLGRTNDALAVTERLLEQFGTNREVALAAAAFYERSALFERDLALLTSLQGREPERADVLVKLGRAQLELSKFQDAIATFDKVLTLTSTDDDARLCRAIALMGADRIEEARRDYESLLKKKPDLPNALFGLGTIAWRQGQTNQALAFYNRFLSNAVPGSAQYAVAARRVKQMRGKGL